MSICYFILKCVEPNKNKKVVLTFKNKLVNVFICTCLNGNSELNVSFIEALFNFDNIMVNRTIESVMTYELMYYQTKNSNIYCNR